MDEKRTVRINKYLSANGICSRREADRLLSLGLVTINGQTAVLGQEVGENDRVSVKGKAVKSLKEKVVLAFFKPVGVVCSEKDPHADKLIMDMIQYPIRVTYAGRLDKDSEGLLLLSNDGDLIQAMMKGSHGHEKEYRVRVDKEITEEFLNKMRDGV
ncbi:MAG: pseudouridine synthase [Lachnospiraceae bacterium]